MVMIRDDVIVVDYTPVPALEGSCQQYSVLALAKVLPDFLQGP